MGHFRYDDASRRRSAWNAGKQVGTKRPLSQKQSGLFASNLIARDVPEIEPCSIWRSTASFAASDLVKIRIRDVVAGPEIRTRAIVVQQKTGRPVQFEITSDVRASLLAWLERRGGTVEDYAFPSRIDHARPMSTRQYARLVDERVTAIGLRK